MNEFKLCSRFYYQRLSQNERDLYRCIYDKWSKGESEAKIFLPGKSLILENEHKVHDVVKLIIYENPNIFHLDTSQIYYVRKGNYVIVKATALYSHEEYVEIYNSLISSVNNIIIQINGIFDEYEKLKFLHDYLAENIVYNYGISDKKSHREAHSIVGALLNGSCVCEGYAKAFRLLCDKVKISNLMVIGEAISDTGEEPHAWNIVKLYGKTYHVDVTWDSIFSKSSNSIKDFYLLRSDEIFSFSHKWKKEEYPVCISDYQGNYPLITNKNMLEEYICEKVKLNINKFFVYLSGDFPNSNKFNELLKIIMERNKIIFKKIKSFSFSFFEKLEKNIFVEIEFYI